VRKLARRETLLVALVAAALVLPAVASPRSGARAACPTLTLSPPSGALPEGQVGKAYQSVPVVVSGGSGNYSWSHDYYGSTAGFPPGLATSPDLGQGGYGMGTRTLSGTPTTPGHYSFQISVEDWPEYPNPRQQSCQVSAQYTLVVPGADVGLTQSASPDPVQAGEKISFNVRASNSGEDDASGVVITDTLPKNVQFVDATWSGEDLSQHGTCSNTGSTVTCSEGTITEPNGSNKYVDAVITVIPEQTGTITNSATVTADTYDPNQSNNSSSVDATVQPGAGADLDVGVVTDKARVPSGSTVVYTIAVENRGPKTADDVKLTASIIGALSLLPHLSSTAGSCSLAGRLISTIRDFECSLGPIASGERVQVFLRVKLRSPGYDHPATLRATAKSTTPDPVFTNNTDSNQVTVTAAADLAVVFTGTRPSGYQYQITHRFSWLLAVENHGPDDALHPTVVIALSRPVKGLGARGDDAFACEAASPTTLKCSSRYISADADATLVIRFEIPERDSNVTVSAQVRSATRDPNSANNRTSASGH